MTLGSDASNTMGGANPESLGMLTRIEIDREDVMDSLSPRQRKFLENYLLNDEMRANGVEAYAEAYGYDLNTFPDDDGVYDENGKQLVPSSRTKAYQCCASAASRLLKNVKIQEAKVQILNAGTTEAVVDSKMFWHILHGRGEQSTQMIKEFNKLKGRVQDKVEIKGDEAIQAFYSRILKRNDEKMKQE